MLFLVYNASIDQSEAFDIVMGDIPVHTILNDINTNDNEYHLLQ